MKRLIRVETNPPGARVFLDGKPIGESPVEVPFFHFGTREVMAEKDGYARTSMMVPIESAWYEIFPLDLFTELLLPIPRTDLRSISMKLRPVPRSWSGETDPAKEAAALDALLQRAKTMRDWSPLSR